MNIYLIKEFLPPLLINLVTCLIGENSFLKIILIFFLYLFVIKKISQSCEKFINIILFANYKQIWSSNF